MSEPASAWPDKHPDAELDYAVNFESECARKWSKWTDFAQGVRIRVYNATNAPGFEFEATTGGRSGGRPPAFHTADAAGETVSEGSIVWTARALSSDSLIRTIVGTPAWVADSGVTVANQAIGGMVAVADISGGTDGQDYSVTVTATMSDGNDVVKVCILPVRIPVAA
jgi:hypothetical protein